MYLFLCKHGVGGKKYEAWEKMVVTIFRRLPKAASVTNVAAVHFAFRLVAHSSSLSITESKELTKMRQKGKKTKKKTKKNFSVMI